MIPGFLRLANEADASDILNIYAPYVESTVVSFELSVPDLETFQGRVAGISAKYPYLVYESGQGLEGYAYATAHMERAAYGWNAALTVYLRPEAAGKGLGSLLYSRLMDLLKLQNIQNVYGLVTMPNPASEKLHKRLGFKEAGIWEKAGFKFDRWLDVVWYHKSLGSHRAHPPAVISCSELGYEQIEKVLRLQQV